RASVSGGRHCTYVALAGSSSATGVNVAKALPDLTPKGEKGQKHGRKRTVRDNIQSQEPVQLGCIWLDRRSNPGASDRPCLFRRDVEAERMELAATVPDS